MEQTYIVHFGVDEVLNKYLVGKRFPFHLSYDTLPKIRDKETIEIITIKSQSIINKEILRYFPGLKLIITRTIGTDHIDLKTCQDRKVEVRNIDYGVTSIAEHSMALLLAGSRNVIKANNDVHKGKFSYEDFLGVGLKGKTLGVIGTGKIGLAFIRLAKAFDLKIIAFDVVKNEKAARELSFKYIPLENLLTRSDFISIHVSLLPETKHMIGEKEIKHMKNEIILVNTSRGAVIDTKALVKYIKKFKAVCLDVLEDELNFSKSHPLLKYDNVIITPHIAFYTDLSVIEIARQTNMRIDNYLKGN